jgi:prephenate dehydratase
MFYADLEADIESPELAPVMEKLQEKSENLRILGRY